MPTKRLSERKISNKAFQPVQAFPQVFLNALVVGSLLRYAYGVAMPLWLCMLSVGLGQAAACYALGLPVMKMMRRIPKRYF